MNKKAAVLAYPNSNNLGDYTQSIAAKLLLREQEVVELDRDNLDSYSGDPVKLVMNGWFMEEPTHWPPSEQIQPLFISFHLNPTAQNGMLTEKGIAYLRSCLLYTSPSPRD